jgi:O-antigen export system, ATP-binding protein
MAEIKLEHVGVEIPVFNSQGRSLKKKLMGIATGGKIGLTEKGKTVIQSLTDVNLHIKDYERVGLLGHNGAGKSTLLRVLGKVYTPTVGVARISGSIGSLIDISLGIDSEATGIENIFLRGALLGVPRKKIEKDLPDIIEFSELGEFINMPVRTYSTGMHMRLAFSVSTIIRPEILLMDEWLSVGDKGFQEKAERRLTEMVNESNILVIASHSRTLIEKCCTRALLLEHGQIVMDSDPETVCNAYFGLT